MKRPLSIIMALCLLCVCTSSTVAQSQNWSLVLRDNTASTPSNQVNGVAGKTATLYATLYNFTGTLASDDGSGNPAPATTLDFAGFGFTLNPGQDDLGSLFIPDPRIPGWPQVAGSVDGTTPGTSGYVTLGMFDLSGLAPGTYQEDFTAGAYPDDINSTVPFDDIHGVLTLNVTSAVPECGTLVSFGSLLAVGFLILWKRSWQRNKRSDHIVFARTRR